MSEIVPILIGAAIVARLASRHVQSLIDQADRLRRRGLDEQSVQEALGYSQRPDHPWPARRPLTERTPELSRAAGARSQTGVRSWHTH